MEEYAELARRLVFLSNTIATLSQTGSLECGILPDITEALREDVHGHCATVDYVSVVAETQTGEAWEEVHEAAQAASNDLLTAVKSLGALSEALEWATSR